MQFTEILQIVMIFQLLVFSISLLVGKKKFLSYQMLGIHFLAIACTYISILVFKYFNINFPPSIQDYSNPGYWSLNYLWGPTLYIYVKSVVYNNFQLQKKDLSHFIPFILASILFYILIRYPNTTIVQKDLLGPYLFEIVYKWIIYSCLALQTLVYILLTLKLLISCNRQIKNSSILISKKNVNWLNYFVTSFIIWYFLSVAINVYFFLSNDIEYLLGTYLSLYIFSFIFYNIIYIMGWHQPEIFSGIESKKYRSQNLTKDEADRLIIIIDSYLKSQKPFLTPGLTIQQLAQPLKIPTHILSRIFNEYYHKNFRDYMNKLRIDEAKLLLLDVNKKKTILEILYETGFNSKATFNTYFKKETGLTPKIFKAIYKNKAKS